MKAETALVRHAPAPEPWIDLFQREPFFSFLDALRRQNQAAAKTGGGGALWKAMPVERFVADSIMPVLIQAANLTGLHAHTELQIQALARRVHPFLDVGLRLCYPSGEAAARAFGQAVADGLKQQKRASPVPAAVLWTGAGARFFASIVKTAAEYGKEIRELAKKIHGKNEVVINRTVWRTIESLHDQQTWALEFSIKGDDASWPSTREICHMREYLAWREQLQESLQILLPSPENTRGHTIGPVSDSPIEERWFQTQILRAVLRLPFGENVTAPQYTQGIRTLKKLETDEITSRFFASSGQKASRLSPAQRQILSAHLRMLVDPSFDGDKRCMRAWGDGVDHAANDRVCVRWKPEEFVVTDPLEVALGVVPNPFASIPRAARASLVQRRILRYIRWDKLSLDDFDRLLETGVIPAETVFTRLQKMGARGLPILKKHLRHPEAESVRTFLLNRKSVQADLPFFMSYGKTLSEKEWRRLLPKLFLCLSGHGTERSEDIVSLLAVAAARLNQNGNNSGLGAARWRQELVKALYREGVLEALARIRSNWDKENAFSLFVSAIGGETAWHRLVLACEIHHRMGLYREWKKAHRDDPIPCPWQDLGTDGSEWMDLPHILGLTEGRLLKLLEWATEPAVFAWMFEHRKDKERLWKAYIASKKRFESHLRSLSS